MIILSIKIILIYLLLGKDITQANRTFFPISEYEQEWRRNIIDYTMRFCGHCNTTTDIKEANFFGK
jgi:WD and tetratricopeptide repeat-containing protein 1